MRNTINKLCTVGTITLGLTAFVPPALSAPYIGFAIGPGFYEADLSAQGGGSIDENGTASKLYGGYTINEYLSTEVAYYNFSEASVGAVETAPGSGMFVSAATSMKGLGAYLVGMYPVNRKTNLVAKLGALSWDAELTVNNTTVSNDGTDVAFALGASYAFTKALSVTAEWESFQTDNPETSMLALGFRFNFR